jgi:hypothetical protein
MNDHDLIQQIQSLKAIKPSSQWAFSARANFVSILDADTKLSTPRIRQMAETRGFLSILRSATAFALTAFVLAAVGASAVNQSLPGQPLYSAKMALEGAQTTVTPGADKLNLKATFTERRVDEASQLASNKLSGEEADTLTQKLEGYRKDIAEVRESHDSDALSQKVAVVEEQTRVLAAAINDADSSDTFEKNLRNAVEGRLSECDDEDLVADAEELMEEGGVASLIDAHELSLRCADSARTE